MTTQDRIDSLIGAFKKDGFAVNGNSGIFSSTNGKIGIIATHSATIGITGVPKKAYYVEGAPYDMGYLMGIMAEVTIERMCTEFNEKALIDFINPDVPDDIAKVLGAILDDVIVLLSGNIYPDVPQQYKEELEGMLEGCRTANPSTKVTRNNLWILNVGFDAVLSFIYTLKTPIKKLFPIELKPKHFRIPLMCNGFSFFGKDSQDKPYHYMGRDFMFPTAGVFQDTATMIVCKPDSGLPFVSMTAPGIIGSITAMNINGVGIGVDMSPSGNCNPSQPGLNSLLLNRHAIQNGGNCAKAVDIIVNAQRGVSWNYILADGTTDMACIVEAGETTENIDFLSYPPDFLQGGILQPVQALLNNPSAPIQRGLMVRWNGKVNEYVYPEQYVSKFNQSLFADFKNNPLQYGYLSAEPYTYTYNEEDFRPDSFLDKMSTDNNCPMAYYFAPIRYAHPNLVMTTNHYVIPEMRLCSMAKISNMVAQGNWDDIQWRYDELNKRLKEIIEDKSLSISQLSARAKETVDFLAPYGDFPSYYNKNSDDIRKVAILGSVSLLDLQSKKIESHYGYYGDEWISIHLENYL